CQKAFIELKNRLVSAPILVHFSDKYPIVIYVDASGYGIGAVLSLLIDEKEHVVAYASRTLTENEKKFGISEKECLALLWAITYKFQCYNYRRKFTIVTDHHPLCWLMKVRDPSSRLTRWSLRLQEFEFDIRHKRGSIHFNADCLSRFPMEVADTGDCDEIPIDSVDIKSLQLKDEWCRHVIQHIDSDKIKQLG
ncbi:pol polyprotein-like protein, partial [Leptotrombidium deliense]